MPKTRFDAQVLAPYLRWGRMAAMTLEESLASGQPPQPIRVLKQPTFLQLQAQRRNVSKSTGPRTSGGKRRAALNSTKWEQCSKAQQMVMALEGRDPFEFRRLHRQLIHWFEPWDSYSRRLVANVAQDWWEKLGAPRGKRARRKHRAPADRETRDGRAASPDSWRGLDHHIERSLGILVDALALHSRKSKYLLETRLEKPVRQCKTVSDLRRQIEEQLKAARIPVKYPHATRMKKTGMNAGGNRVREENVRNVRDVILNRKPLSI